MTEETIILQGGGEHARVVLDALLDSNRSVIALFDPKYNGDLFGIPQLGAYQPYFEPSAKSIIAIGDNTVRKKVANKSAHSFTNAIHPSAVVSNRAVIGSGTMILHRAVIQAQSVIGDHVIINTGAQVDHDCRIGDYVHLAPGVVICGSVTVGEGTFVGAGAVVIPGKKIGAWAIVGAGSVVVKDVPDYAVVVGNPARVIRMQQRTD